MSTPTTTVIHSPSQRRAIADGYLAAIILLSMPLWAGFLGQIASTFNRGFQFPIAALTAAALYVFAVYFAIAGLRKSPLGSRIAAGFTLVGALFLPLFWRTIL